MLDAPVLKNGEMIGVVCHEHVGPPREWTTEERDFAMSVADAVAAKIKSAELLIARSAIRHHAELAPGEDRLEVVGRLAAGVAHDFKNLLAVVIGNAGLIARRGDLPPDVTQRANNIVEASDRGAQLVRELLEFGREPGGQARVLDVTEVVETFLPILQSSISPDSPIEFTCEPGAGKVMVDRGNLERVLLNLVFNARDAMPTGGTIHSRRAEWTTDGDGPAGATSALMFRTLVLEFPRKRSSGSSTLRTRPSRRGRYWPGPGGGSSHRGPGWRVRSRGERAAAKRPSASPAP